ncbi:MAG: hypothetical protein R3A13_09865 [Bdellovibrionota bacterium]
MKFSYLLLSAIFGIIFISSPAFAQEELVVKDTGGFTRASSAVDGAGSVEFSLVNEAGLAADGVEVTLTNAATGETLTGVAANGTVVFEGVTPGVWTVASTAPGVTFTSVTVISTAAVVGGAGLGTAAAIGIGGTAIGGTAIAVNEANNSNNNDPISPSS